MSRRAREAHPAGKRRSIVAEADSDATWAWADTERSAAAANRAQERAEVWRRRYWMTATAVIFVTGLVLWAFGAALIWSVVR